MYEATLTLGLPHTNRWGLAEHLLMQHAGHLQWTAIAAAIGTPLSRLRTAGGQPVYGTFYFVETEFPPDVPIESFQLDDTVRFHVEQRAFKSIAVEGRIEFSRDGQPRPRTLPRIRFGNIFITPDAGNSALKVAAPADVDFSRFTPLPNDENPFQITRAAAVSGCLDLVEEAEWKPVGTPDGFASSYAIDPDRDTNGAGLVYFANYFAFLDAAERAAAASCHVPEIRDAAARLVQRRRTAFYGNVDVTDRIRTRVRFLQSPAHPSLAGVRYAMHREGDDALICLSEAIKRCVHA